MTTPIATLAGQRRRPRVGVDFHSFEGRFQGSRTHLLGLYRDLVRRAPEYDFIFFSADPARLREVDPAFRMRNVRCIEMPQRRGMARLGWQLAWMRWRHHIDLLHVQYRMPFLPLGECAVTIHDTLYETHPQFFRKEFVRAARFLGWLSVRRAALVLTVSQWSHGEIVRLYGIDKLLVTVAGNGVNLARFHPVPADAPDADERNGADIVRALGVRPGSYLLAVGRLEPRKNQLNLVRAYALLAEPRPPLLIVGQRDLEHDEAFTEVAALGLQSEVTFLERVADAELPALVRHARLFVHVSFAEGFGMPVLEAMASGVAVVASDIPALAEVTLGAAVSADPHEPKSIADAVETLLFDGALRRRLAAQGLQVAAGHRWDVAAKSVLSAFRRFFAGRRLR